MISFYCHTSNKKDKKDNSSDTNPAIHSLFYDPCWECTRHHVSGGVENLTKHFKSASANMPILTVLNADQEQFWPAQFGQMPFGSQIIHQRFFLPPDFVVYSNLPESNNRYMKFIDYPLFPFTDTDNAVSSHIHSIVDDHK